MSIAVTIILGLAVLSLIVLVHELGHFITAKAKKVRVEEFGIGLPPRLLSFKRGETLYSLNALPIGGFNKLTGEEDPTDPHSLASKSAGTRLLILGAGSFLNIVLAFLLLSIAFTVPHQVVKEPILVNGIAPGSPAALAGIQPGDTIVSADGKTLQNIIDLLRTIQLNLGDEISMVVEHADSTTEHVTLTPRWKPPENEGAIGVELDLQASAESRTVVTESYPPWKAIPRGATALFETFILYKDGIFSMITGTASVEVAGPVGIMQMVGEAAKAGISPLLEFAAILSFIIGIINIFPLPALDGGRIAFILLELIRRGRRISPQTERIVHLVGFFMMIAVFLVVTYNDIARIVAGG